MSVGQRKERRVVNVGLGTFFVIALVGLIGMVAVAPSVKAESLVTSEPPRTSQLQQYADELRDAGATGVLVHSRFDNQHRQVRSGVAKRGTSRPVPYDAHFKTGSTTKTFVSVVMLQLEAEGKLSLDDSLEQWLPDVMGPNYNESQMTLRSLLNHTSGVFDYTTDEAFFATLETTEAFEANRFKNYTVNDLLDIARTHPALFEPGTSWEYSSTNTILAGEVIKKVTGKSWDKEVKNRILIPLGMTETSSAGSSAGLPSPFAHAYHIFTSDSTARTYTDTTLHNMSWGGAAGDMITTTKDENRFFRALMKGALLPPAQLSEMKTIVPLGEGVGYGLGLVWASLPCDERGYWSHNGGVVGYFTDNGVTDDGKRSVVVSVSTTTFSDEAYATDLGELDAAIISYALCGEDSSIRSNQSAEDAGPRTHHILHTPNDAMEQLRERL